MVCGTAVAKVEPVPKDFDKGLIFVKDTDILLSGDKWTIVVNIALDDYTALVNGMRVMLNQIWVKIQTYKNPKTYDNFDIHWEEVSRLDVMVRGLDADLQSVRALLYQEPVNRGPKNRDNRGLLNVLGYGLKYLFGTADARDVKRLTAVCDKLHEFEARMTHAVDHQLTYIRTLDEVTKQNAQDIANLTGTLRDVLKTYSVDLNRVEADLYDTQNVLIRQVRFTAAIREIEMAMLDLKFSITQLQESLDVTSMGQLSSVLINPFNLSVILQQVSLQLPAGLTMLTGLTVEDMYVYYTIATVHAVASPNVIRLLIDIPLKAADRYFELYQVHSLPFFQQDIGKFVMIDEMFTYLAVAESRQYFAVLTPNMLSRCTQGLYTVCPSDMVLMAAGEYNCLTALFMGKTEVVYAKCKRLILSEPFEPVWIRSPDASYWIYSLNAPQRVTVQCQGTGSPPTDEMNSQMILRGTGMLPNSSSCYIYAEKFKLLPHSWGKTTVFLDKARIVLPSIENILNFPEGENLLQSTASRQMDLRQLDGIVERATSRSQTRGVDVTRFTAALRAEDDRHVSTRWLWAIGALVVLSCIAVVWLVWYKLLGMCCPNRKYCTGRPGRSRSKGDKQIMNTCDTGLQVLPSGGRELMASTGTSDGEGPAGPTMMTKIASKSQESLTVFALRGRGLPGDPQ
jgi:hypothetical protein